jgi:hypothetical protein
MKLKSMATFIELFWFNLCCYRHIASSFESGYAARDVNYRKKSFMRLKPVATFIKPSWHKLRCYQHIA